MYQFKNLHDVNLSYKRVLLRLALDLPLKNGKVSEDFRLRQILPTLAYLLKKNCSVVIVTWLGRPASTSASLGGPKGKVEKKYSLAPVAKRLSQLIRRSVKLAPDCVGLKVEEAVFSLQSGEILMLENTRFHQGEIEADPAFAEQLADGFDIEVFDAFAQSHRVHASTTGLLNFLPALAGFLLEKEMQALSGVLERPARPLVLIIGGAKVSDKIELTSHLIDRADKVLIGGVCANVFLAARGVAVGKSYLSDVVVNKAEPGAGKDYFKIAKNLLKKYPHKIMLPEDLIAASSITGKQTEVIHIEREDIPKNWGFYDIGPATTKLYLKQIARAGTILWNGPMGLFENKKFAGATETLVKAVAESNAISIGGGGDTETIIGKYNLVGKFSHVSTGGGAMLEFLSGKKLPALEALLRNQKDRSLWNLAPRPVAEFSPKNNPYWRYPFLNLQKMLAPAIKKKFGVPALNVRSKYILDAILESAFEERSPVIVECAESEMAYCNITPERLADWVIERLPKLEKKYGRKIPVALHIDHTKKDLSMADRAVCAGFSSAAIDQSEYPLPQNIRITRSMVRKFHPLGVTVEGEIGEIGQAQAAKAKASQKDLLRYVPTVEEATTFVAKTGVDVFAGFFGNYHGKYNGPAIITWGRMKQISRAFKKHGWQVPLALHGSSYINTKEFDRVKIVSKALAVGCRKFNHSTILSDLFKQHLPESLLKRMYRYAGSAKDWRKALGKYEREIDKLSEKELRAGVDEVKAHIKMMMKTAWKSSGKAKYYKTIKN